jgi:peptidoglycan/xylan/chitin deacetylase (PgdA/CDA1 family)
MIARPRRAGDVQDRWRPEISLKTVSAILLLAITLLLTIGATACKQPVRGNDKPPVARCMEDLNNIPELAALKARNKEQTEESASGRPLDGMEIALTLNDQVRSAGDPNDVDNWCEREDSRENFDHLLAALKAQQMPPVVDFAIGQGMDGQLASDWVASGNRLGLLTYSHKKPNKSSTEEFIADIARNEQAIGPYQPKTPGQPRYFRFPHMKVSLDPEARARIDHYLRDNGYTVAPATIDALDETFNGIYCAAMSRKDDACVNLLKVYFKSLLLDTATKARETARQLAGHDVKQILVFKADQFTCDMLGEILAWLKTTGVRFITLDEALRDPFYKMVDEEGKPVATGLTRTIKHAQSESGQKR